MSIHGLEAFFEPRSVALIGASPSEGKLGQVVMRNLVEGGFQGPVFPVNPKHRLVSGLRVYSDVAALPEAPDLAVLCTPPATIPGLVGALAARGTRAAVVLTAGLGSVREGGEETVARAMLAAARGTGLRILGPNSVGLLAPHARLNASFAPSQALPGRLAFVSQSGAMCTAVLEWASARKIGFSAFASLGDAADVDFGDLIDDLGADPRTRAILLYVESVGNARKFLSAARGAARNKPIVAIKAGRVPEGERAAATHTGAMAGSDELVDYAFRRAGILRVGEIDALFDAVETLERAGSWLGERIAILTNGGGPGVMAVDALVAGGGKPAVLGEETLRALDAVLPSTWSRSNPIDIIGDAPPERFARAVEIAMSSGEVDVVLVLHAPTAIATSEEVAGAVVRAAKGKPGTLLTSWLGGAPAARARTLCDSAGIASYETPGAAVRAYLDVVRHRHGQSLLQRVPPATHFEVDRERARAIVEEALSAGAEWLDEAAAKEVLAAYGVPIARTRVARDVEHAAELAREIGFPVALKVRSPDVLHKTDVGGVALDLETVESTRSAGEAMIARIASLKPDARLEGFTVQEMVRRPEARELFVGAATDPVFGPFVMFGQGGIAVEVLRDRALALPPLDRLLARDLIERTRVARLLEGYRGRPPAAIAEVELLLVRIAQMLADLPELAELDVNPVLADAQGVVAVDARMRIVRASKGASFAIAAYPRELEETVVLPSGQAIFLRPIRPEDEPAHRRLFESLRPEDVRFRFFHFVRELPHSEFARATQLDYDRELAILAFEDAARDGEELGVVRAVQSPLPGEAEFAVVVASSMQGRGLGRALVEKIVRSLAARGVHRIHGRVLADNAAMLGLARDLGFVVEPTPDRAEVEVALELVPPEP